MWDVVARKLVWIQIFMVANFGSFFESTLMQEMEWHLHTVVFCMVLGYGYTHNRHVRVDFLRENFNFQSKAKVEFYGNILFIDGDKAEVNFDKSSIKKIFLKFLQFTH